MWDVKKTEKTYLGGIGHQTVALQTIGRRTRLSLFVKCVVVCSRCRVQGLTRLRRIIIEL